MAENSLPVSSVRFTKNSKMTLCSYLDSNIGLWERATGKSIQNFKGHVNENYLLPSFILKGEQPTEKQVIALSEDNKMVLWDINKQVPNKVIELKEQDKVKYLDVEEEYENTVACLFGKSKIVVYLI